MKSEIRNQLSSDALSLDSVDELKNNALDVAKTVFEIYESATDDALIDRCDGKQVLGKVCSYYSNLLGVNNKTFKKAVYKEAFSDDQSLVFELSTDIFSRFS